MTRTERQRITDMIHLWEREEERNIEAVGKSYRAERRLRSQGDIDTADLVASLALSQERSIFQAQQQAAALRQQISGAQP